MNAAAEHCSDALTQTLMPTPPSWCSRYYVQSLLNMDEQALHSAWAKVRSWHRWFAAGTALTVLA